MDLSVLRANVAAIRERVGPNVAVMAVVKANAYGHGLEAVAQTAIAAGCQWLGVATVPEGAALRAANVAERIALLTTALAVEAPEIVSNRLTPMVADFQILEALHSQSTHHNETECERPAVHLDIETGMGRSGVLPAEAVALWRHAVGLGFNVEGVATHFADADSDNPMYTRRQQQAFKSARDALRQAGADFAWAHIDSSASIFGCLSGDANLVRPGLLIYGIAPQPDACGIPIRPVLALKARIASVRRLPRGHGVSYGVTHRLTRDSLLATVLIGYGDGYPRALSNRGHMLIHGDRAPILGRVCMDQTVVDVTDIPMAAPGDEAICIGEMGTEKITVEEIAALLNATPHEITTSLAARLPRVYLDH